MDFIYTDEQLMLADTVNRFVADAYSLEARRALAASELGFSPAHWQTFAELGLLGLMVPETYGGAGGSSIEILIVMQALGRALVLEPFLSTAVVAAGLIADAGTRAQQTTWLPAIAAGRRRVALATFEPDARFDLEHIGTRAERSHTQYLLNGRKAVVLHADSADALIVSARTGSNDNEHQGVTLFLVGTDTPGVEIRGFPNIDGQRSAEVTLTNVALKYDAVVGAVGDGFAPLEHALDVGLAALCAEAVGCMERLIEITAEYLRTRQQFGKPIGTFQALQHRLADMAIATEQARAAALLAAARVNDADPVIRRRSVSAAKAMVGRAGRVVGQLAVQLHGGMGMTDELVVGHYFKRLTCIDLTWGDAEHHTELFGRV